MKTLFDRFKPESYVNDFAKQVRVYLIKTIANVIIEKRISDKDSILSYIDIDGKFYNDGTEILNDLLDQELTDSETLALDTYISNQLQFGILDKEVDRLMDFATNFKSENYENLPDFLNDFRQTLDSLNKDMRESSESIEDAKKDVSFSSTSLANTIGTMITKKRNPSEKVVTGIKALNSMFNGGFEKGRTYFFLAPSKGGKSTALLQCAIWAKQYNSFVTSEPGLKPVVLYITMENSNEETIDRIWNYAFGDDNPMEAHDSKDVLRMLEEAKIFTPNDPTSAELMLMYRSNRSISCADIAGILDDLKKDGKECVLLVVDYLKRLRPITPNKDQRIELGNITNELKTIALEYDIPVLSAQQLNRTAFEGLENATTFDEKVKASNNLGVSQISESIDIVQNCDYAIICNRLVKRSINEKEEVEYTDRYMFFKLVACRTKQPDIIAIKHRFRDNNGLALVDDIYNKQSLSTNTEIDMIRQRLEKNPAGTPKGRQLL